MKRLIILLCLLASCCAKVDSDNEIRSSTSPTTPTTPTFYTVEYRVIGSATSVIIRYSNTEDGINQTVSSLPFFVLTRSNKDVLFISLEATPQGFVGQPFMAAQILINGTVFREAATTTFFNPLLISGTYRR